MKKKRIQMMSENAQKCHDGTKTVTRRVMTPQPPENCDAPTVSGSGIWQFQLADQDGEENWFNAKPKYQVGDIVAIAEPYWQWGRYQTCGKSTRGSITWRFVPYAHCTPVLFEDPDTSRKLTRHELGFHKRPSIFMPFDLARTYWEILDVSAERLQEITEADCIAEGVEAHDHGGLCACVIDGYANPLPANPRELAGGEWRNRFGFEILWDSINAHRGYPWSGNWWVWRYEGKRVEKP